MTFVSRLTMAAALAFAAPIGLSAPALAQALSAGVGKPLQEASKLANAGNNAAATARVNAARSAASTAVERRKVAEMAAFVHTKGGRWAAAAQELESIGAPASQLAPLYYRAGQLDKAITLGKKTGGVQGQTIVAQSYFRQGNFKGAADVYQNLIKQNGAREAWLQSLANAQFKMNDKKGYLATTERLIKVDPSPARWRALLVDMKNGQMPREAKLALFELMEQTGNITKPEDYQEYAKLAIVANQPALAKRSLESGMKAGVIPASDSMNARLLEAAAKRSAAASAGVSKLPKTGAGQLQAGHVAFGAGDYARAAALYGAAAKAGGATADQAKVLAGISQLRSGNRAAASGTFKSIPEASAYSGVAGLWALYTSTSAA
ncbi:tetratricopeptide repeat protein [Sphingosinicella soli]|uniref:Tetratricopeptide repeat protein n=1 Tax=Sphingosinicella soli TaxID=333708 RepID=A0A7W7AYY4_9SPHN|nr:tetratricopeptide repeat protein [Sphingosinicella soli]MBB4630941.1 hypothetical protein [Sphingosinicella soli]